MDSTKIIENISKEIQELDQHSEETINSRFQSILDQISQVIESIHLAVFTIEQNLIDYIPSNLQPLQLSINQLEPHIHILNDVYDNLIGTQEPLLQQKVTKIQSEWSSLQHFKTHVKNQLLSCQDEFELKCSINQVLIKIDDLSVLIFEFQERKFMNQSNMPTTSLSFTTNSTTTDITNTNDSFNSSSTATTSVDQSILEIDNQFDLILKQIEFIYHRMNSVTNSQLTRNFDKIKEKWELLQIERDELKYEHKEDRWLIVFRRVADQVDVMIDGLDRSVVQCYTIVQQTRDYFNYNKTGAFNKLSKSLMSPFQHNPSSATSTTIPVDKEKFRSIEKSFEAKYKYYTPSIDRMLGMLGSGISARASKDNLISSRHEAMFTRWQHLKEVMDELRKKDLIEAERLLHSGSSPTSSSWKGIRYKTPEPQQRSITPSYYQQQQSLLRGSISDSSSVGSSPSTVRSSSRQTNNKTPRPTRNTSIGIRKEDFYDEDERYYGVDLMKARPPSAAAATNNNRNNYNGIRSNSTMEVRKRSTSVEKPVVRSKTPQLRSKSSMGDFRQPPNRSVTPSLIPRPKTPTTPKSDRNSSNKPPPVPPIPKYVISHESDYAQYRGHNINKKNNKKTMEISFHEDCVYRPDPKDPLDVEVAQIVNASPISIQCQRGSQSGRYFFGNEASLSSMGGKKMYTCKLMTYQDRRGGQFKNNKVLIRVGGGWQDLEFFLLEHSSLMASDVVVRSFS